MGGKDYNYRISADTQSAQQATKQLADKTEGFEDLLKKGQAAAQKYAASVALTSKEASALGRATGLTAGEVQKLVKAESLAAGEARKLAQAQIEAEKGTRGLKDAANQTADSVKNLDKAMGAAASVAGALGIAFGAREILAAGVELNNLANAADRAAFSLDAMTDGQAAEFVNAIGEASHGTISDLEAMAIANRAVKFGLVDSAAEMAKLTEVAAALGRVMGTDTVTAFDDLVTAGARQSKMIADNLGIIVDMNRVQSDANALMAADATLTEEAARSKAFLNQILESGNTSLAQMGGLTSDNAEQTERLKAQWANFKMQLGQSLGPLSEVTGALADFLEGQSEMIEATRDQKQVLLETTDSAEEYIQALKDAGMATEAAGVGRATREWEEYHNAISAAAADLTRFDNELGISVATTSEATLSAEELAEAEEQLAEQTRQAEAAVRAHNQALQEAQREQEALTSLIQSSAEGGASYLDFLRATGVELANMPGQYDSILSKTGELTDAQMNQKTAMDLLGQSIRDGLMLPDEGIALFDQISNGTLKASELAGMIGVLADKKETLAADPFSMGDPTSAQEFLDATQTKLDENTEKANEFGLAYQAQVPLIEDGAKRVQSALNPITQTFGIYDDFFDSAPAASKAAFDGIAKAAQANWEVLGTTAGFIDGIADNWRYLQANSNLKLNVNINQNGAIPGGGGGSGTAVQAGGGTFLATGPVHLTVGDNPDHMELVHTIPIGRKGVSSYSGPNIMRMGGGGDLLAGAGIGGTVININGSINLPNVLNPADFIPALERELKAQGKMIPEVA